MTDHVFLRIMQLKMFGFNLSLKIAFITVSRVITTTVLFLQFVLYSSSFVGTPKVRSHEVPRKYAIQKLSSSRQTFSNSAQSTKIILIL